MHATHTKLEGLLIIEPRVFEDERGFFFESFNHRNLENTIGESLSFVQDNHSRSTRNVLRGLHYQLEPKAQGKLVRVLQGEIYDVAVDIRKNSPTFGQWVGEKLSALNKKQLWIPKGFLHGFLALSENTEVLYKVTDYYSPELERCVSWDDKHIGIDWPLEGEPVLSDKDRLSVAFEEAEYF
jgi:dTDP-4-dehydrorhamnose 3,5-epimerase